ncbi:MAG: LytTR family DNA-binding domain-containing protein [Bacteroidia bacterium]|nr:LytTR family DNA-binding domain-containing protein [Bacteroidia bacterium]
MKVLIIEDEPLAAERLIQLIHQYESHIEILDILDSIESAVEWFQENPTPDLVFQDIELADGSSFRIFEQIKAKPPVIFVTAYDAFALQAFKANSVDYLLKPIDFEELANAMDKFVKVFWEKNRKQRLPFDIEALADAIQGKTQTFKERFVVKKGEFIHPIPVSDILYFYSEDKVSFIRTRKNERYILDETLNEIEDKLDPKEFFRVNRQFLCRFEAIKEIVAFSQRRLKLSIEFAEEKEILVSRERIRDFKNWLDR